MNSVDNVWLTFANTVVMLLYIYAASFIYTPLSANFTGLKFGCKSHWCLVVGILLYDSPLCSVLYKLLLPTTLVARAVFRCMCVYET